MKTDDSNNDDGINIELKLTVASIDELRNELINIAQRIDSAVFQDPNTGKSISIVELFDRQITRH